MLSQKGLTKAERRKQTIIAYNDRLREECGEIWGAVGHRIDAVERGFCRLRWLPPVLSLASTAGLFYLRQRSLSGRGGKFLGPLLAVASQAISASRGHPRPR